MQAMYRLFMTELEVLPGQGHATLQNKFSLMSPVIRTLIFFFLINSHFFFLFIAAFHTYFRVKFNLIPSQERITP